MRALKLGTRGSRLALWQASFVARELSRLPGCPDIEVVIVKTRGDAVHDRPIAQVGVGVFVKELEDLLLQEQIDFAVHSLKDLETVFPEGLVLAAVPQRAPVEDCLVAAKDVTVGSLAEGAVIATGSPRRRALLRDRRPDLVFKPLRGNVPTRLDKVAAGEADATILARAGLERLELTDMIRETLDPAEHPPAPGQGALGIQCRASDGEALTLL
ncbi:MAG: hydroxymethylbilane synthase, partial [Planctomycetota bacterium]